jgi:glucose-1-phosphate adenylyltransferase
VDLPKEEGRHFGVLELDAKDRVVGFEEKPLHPKTLPEWPDLICASMGIYIFSLNTLYEELIPDAGKESEHDFGKNILPQMLGRRALLAYHFVDENQKELPYWRDIGTLDAYYEANMDLVSVSPQFNLYDQRWPIRTYQPQLPPVKMVFADPGEGARRGEALDSIMSTGCVISGGSVTRSVLSAQVRVNSYASVEDSVLMDGVSIGRRARVKNAIIDKYVDILPETTIGYDLEEDRKRFHVTDSGIVVIPKGRIISPDEDRPRWEDHTRPLPGSQP